MKVDWDKFFFLLYLDMMFIGMFLFFTGFHNIDYAVNVRFLMLSEGIDPSKYRELTIAGPVSEGGNVLDDLLAGYMYGWYMVFIGLVLVYGSGLGIGMYISRNLQRVPTTSSNR